MQHKNVSLSSSVKKKADKGLLAQKPILCKFHGDGALGMVAEILYNAIEKYCIKQINHSLKCELTSLSDIVTMYGGMSMGTLNATHRATQAENMKINTALFDHSEYLYQKPTLTPYYTKTFISSLVDNTITSDSIDNLFVSISYDLNEKRPTIWSNTTDIPLDHLDISTSSTNTSRISTNNKTIKNFTLYDATRASSASLALEFTPEIIKYHDGLQVRECKEVDAAPFVSDSDGLMLEELINHYKAQGHQLESHNISLFTLGSYIAKGSMHHDLLNRPSLSQTNIINAYQSRDSIKDIHKNTKSYLGDEGVQAVLKELTQEIEESLSAGFIS